MNPLETYLRDLHTIRSTGAGLPETSYYGPLQNLFNEVGKTLKPKVRCIMGLGDVGAGFPDGGLFTPDQFQKSSTDLLAGQLPSRGVIEVKPVSDDAWVTADGPQVSRYWGTYQSVLVTNYRDFLVVGRDTEGRPAKLESYRLAGSEREFRAAAAHPRKTADAHAERFTEYLELVMLRHAPLASPQSVARFLAYYAREAKARIGQAGDLPALATVRQALEDALGLKFEGDKGEHFFRSSLVQTLFYGVFSAWVIWARKVPHKDRRARFDWRTTGWLLRVPMVRALFEQVATQGKLGPLGLVEVLNWAEAALNRVDRTAFFAQFHEGQAVQYFYEPFLQAFDPELRKDLGVWFTPPEIVQYMVARVDTVLREELDIEDGLADPRVYVLDPCCGTGSYLVEVLRRIAATLKEEGAGALLPSDLKAAVAEWPAQPRKQEAHPRIFGFEILPAPFVVAHLQLGLLLDSLGSPLDESASERASVYLTNALTGWEPPKGPKQHLIYPELEQERDAAEKVKRDTPILVILGNPPYNAFAGTSPAEEDGLVEPYKEGLISEWGIKKFNLDDLYVRFFRLAERRIAEMTGQGVICYISNFSYLSDPSFVVMRKRFLEEFDRVWIDCMNGDSRETGKLTPEGKPDPSVFSTEQNREGIRVGTSICVLVRKGGRAARPSVLFRHFWGTRKRADLVASLQARRFHARYSVVRPAPDTRYSFRPALVTARYARWPKVAELCAITPSNGLMEKRAGALIDTDRARLEQRMRDYFDKRLDWQQYRTLHHGLTHPRGRFRPQAAREKALARESFAPERVVRYAVRPFDVRWCYYTGIRPIWNEPRPRLWGQYWKGNSFLMARPAGVATPEGVPFCFTSALGDNDALRGHAYYFPVHVRNGARLVRKDEMALFRVHGNDADLEAPTANLSDRARQYLSSICVKDPDDERCASLLWSHVLAVGYSPAYLKENAGGIRSDWPRLPLPATRHTLLASAELGQQVAALLDTESPEKRLMSGRIRAEMRVIGVESRVGGGSLSLAAGDLAVTAGWGHAGKGGVTMPGKGKAEERDCTAEELAAIEAGAAELGLSREQAVECLGKTTFDVYLNGVAYWRNVPARVWDYTIGGYQVMKKWLSYRERELLGRPLTLDEAHYVTEMARRLAALVLLEPALDANYEAVKASAYPWPAEKDPGS